MLLHSDVADISRVCREGKCAGISVLADGVEDGFLDLEAFVKDQHKAEGKFPGPCAVISGSPVSSARGVAEAAASGATAVTLAAPSKGRDEGAAGKALKGLLASCAALELGAICEVRSHKWPWTDILEDEKSQPHSSTAKPNRPCNTDHAMQIAKPDIPCNANRIRRRGKIAPSSKVDH